jgi:MoxR-like ATPase
LLREEEAHAVEAAVLSGRPLLVMGEPGVGKSQLARAAAVLLRRRFLSVVVQPNTEYEELLWTLDLTTRLAMAQAGRASELAPERYIRAGPLWWALNWESAEQPDRAGLYQPFEYDGAPEWQRGCVLLVDEIDKADVSVADGLLEALGNGAFSVPPLRDDVKRHEDQPAPLVVFTSNEARIMSPAFVRRCVPLRLELEEGAKLIQYLCEVGAHAFPSLEDSIRRDAAELIVEDRSVDRGMPRTGQAEYLDLLRTLDSVQAADRRSALRRLGRYFLKSRDLPR